ncbi:MAG: hypothetical protein M0015_14440 [Betaproteobacteria bacterium]|nr:hypothetical protein [Betaproteobacteria bacterium]
MAAVYKEHKRAKTWSVRVRILGRSLFKSGFKSKAAAADGASEQQILLKGAAEPKGIGPSHTTLAVALRDYAHDSSALKESCSQEPG